MSAEPLKFLAVEDDDVDMMALRRALKDIGLANPIEHVFDGQEALDLLLSEDESVDLASRYLIFLDLNLPRMNGHEFLTAVRDNPRLKGIRVFVLTTSDAHEDITGAFGKQVEAYLLKSDLRESLTEAIGEAKSKWMLVD